MILKNGGNFWATGYNGFWQFGNGIARKDSNVPIQVLTGVSYVSAGMTYTMIIKTDGTL